MENERNSAYRDEKWSAEQLAKRDGMPRLEIKANLECELDGRKLSVRTIGRTLHVEVPDVATGMKLARLGSPRGAIRESVHRCKHFLDAAQMTVSLRRGNDSLGVIGFEKGSSFWRIVGLPALELKPLTIAKLYIRECMS